MPLPKTKIIATLGPASESKDQIRALIQAGMSIVRLNFSHGNYEEFKSIVKKVRELEKELGKTVLIFQDLQGPKIRLGVLPPEGIVVKKGQVLHLDTRSKIHQAQKPLPLPYAPLPKVLKVGHRLFIEDGLIRTVVTRIQGPFLELKVEVGGLLKSHKGVNIPDSKLPNELALTAKDKKDLHFGIKTLKVDAVALSFVEEAEDVERVRKKVQSLSKKPTFLIAKIERPKALKNLHELVKAADAVMVARGDLGVETPAEAVPLLQRQIIQECRSEGKPVIVATQILQSMVENAVATRAEISDAATAIFEQTDAFMLSNETATGKHPIEAVKTLFRVAKSTEAAIEKKQILLPQVQEFGAMGGTLEDHRMAKEAWRLAEDIQADALVIATKQGYTARAVLRYRPNCPIVIVSNEAARARLLHFHWGVNEVLLIKGRLRAEEVREKLRKHPHFQSKKRLVFLRLGKSKRSLVVMELGR
ncbi:pyruvate kinase [Candidatus Peregrinibacteria bacterium]|nr:MAG: pyruvate kinase [Candidatus Peregrinibacteria bacterium]